jgi:mannose-1-phosphate guanylyltransferase
VTPGRYGLILAGGRGTRFWPRSRRRHSKQVLKVTGTRSLIQATVDRLAPLIPSERLYVLTNEYLRDEIVRQLPGVPPQQILAEPAQRNTAPAIGLAAQILRSIDPHAVMGVFPSDHVIANEARFRELAGAAFQAAEGGKLAVLGIQPRWPETGYGYIEFAPGIQAGSLEASPVRRFHEKPNAEAAVQYLEAGRFFWNAGMFFWRADVILDELARYQPAAISPLAALPRFGDAAFDRALRACFPQCENISIDYAVLERSNNVVGIACDDIGWTDLGSWNALYEILPRDAEGNAGAADAIYQDSRGNYVHADDKLVALIGVSDLIVVDTPDALLIVDRKQAQRVAEIVKLLEQRNREDLL